MGRRNLASPAGRADALGVVRVRPGAPRQAEASGQVGSPAVNLLVLVSGGGIQQVRAAMELERSVHVLAGRPRFCRPVTR